MPNIAQAEIESVEKKTKVAKQLGQIVTMSEDCLADMQALQQWIVSEAA